MAKALLITGGAGYIGSHVVRALVLKGYPVVVLDDFSKGHAEALPREARVVRGDVGERSLLKIIFREHRIHAVLHFAAESIVPESIRNPLRYYFSNVSKSIDLLRESIDAGVRSFIFSSTAAVYGEPMEIPISEHHPIAPLNPYGASKWMIEQVLEDCHRAHGLRFVSLRYFNAAGAHEDGMIGESHDPETHLIPLLLEAALGNMPPIKVFGTDYDTPDGTCIRDYIHVNDLARAHILAMEALEQGLERGIYNLGNGEGYSVKEVIETAMKVIGRAIPFEEADRREGDPARLIASSKRIEKELGWKPQHPDLEYILQTAWKWHRNRRY